MKDIKDIMKGRNAMFSIQERPLVVFDCETTGLSPKNDKIIELGAVKLIGNQKTSTYHQLFDPQMTLPKKIIELTHITDEMLQGQPTLEKEFFSFLQFIEGCILIAHNLTFDYSFIYHTAQRIGKEVHNKGICTLLMAQHLFPRKMIEAHKNNPLMTNPMPASHKLGDLSTFFQVPLVNAHRADEDALATARVFWKLLHQAKTKDYSILFDLVKEREEILEAIENRQKQQTVSFASKEQLQYIESLLQQIGTCTLLKSLEHLKKSDASSVIEVLLQYKQNKKITENEWIGFKA